MNERITFDSSSGLCPVSQELGGGGWGWAGGDMRKVLVSVITSLLSATWRWGLGVEKSKQLGDQESGDWGSGPCSASNLLCDFELLASPFWNLISK